MISLWVQNISFFWSLSNLWVLIQKPFKGCILSRIFMPWMWTTECSRFHFNKNLNTYQTTNTHIWPAQKRTRRTNQHLNKNLFLNGVVSDCYGVVHSKIAVDQTLDLSFTVGNELSSRVRWYCLGNKAHINLFCPSGMCMGSLADKCTVLQMRNRSFKSRLFVCYLPIESIVELKYIQEKYHKILTFCKIQLK